jgi:beta-glucanase (GH16 family)
MAALKRMTVAAAALAAIAGCSSQAASSSQAGAAQRPAASPSPSASPTPAWKLAWSDSFKGAAGRGLDPADWKYDVGRGIFGTSEVEYMSASTSNVHLDGQGNLDLTALSPGAAGGSPDYWTSGRVQTKQLFGAPAGGEMMVTASMKQPDPAHGSGYWPGFWMLGPNPGTWPTTGEVDIIEDVNALSVHSGTLHCGNLTDKNADGTTGPCHEGNGLGSGLIACATCETQFHTYSVVVDRRTPGDEQIRWYFDNRQFFSVSESQVGTTAWTAAVDHGFSILLDLAIGGSFPDAQCQCTTPDSETSSGSSMVFRNVSVYTN